MKKQYCFCRTALLLCAWLFSSAAWAYDFVVDGIYYNITSSQTVEVTNGGDYSGDVTIPEMVTNEGIEYRVTAIGNSAFSWCSGLTSVTIPESVTAIGNKAFYDCEGLTSITIPESVTLIGEYAFRYCRRLTSVTIPGSVISIGNYAFGYCSGLKSVTIGEGVTTIGAYAFDGCTGLTSITIPDGVTSIGKGAFYGCTGLERFDGKFATDNGRGLIVSDTLFTAFAPSGLTEYSIPESVTTIGSCAFSYCTGLTSVTIPDGVTSIGKDAFLRCSGLTSVTIPDGVARIGVGAFRDCEGLTSVTIGKGVSTIGEAAFSDCKNLTSVTAYNPTPVDIDIDDFDKVDCANCTLYVPAESVEKYKAATGWKEFGEILPIDESSAITEIRQDKADEHVTVYNLQGVLVLETDDAAALRTLSAGAYIVNGKTMIIAR